MAFGTFDSAESLVNEGLRLMWEMQVEIAVLLAVFAVQALLLGRRKASTRKGLPTATQPAKAAKIEPAAEERRAGEAVSRATMTRQGAYIRQLGLSGRLDDAASFFSRVPSKNRAVYNAFIEACVECGDVARAEGVLKEAAQEGLADMISFNTLLKGRLHAGNIEGARETIAEMRRAGLQPNAITFNEFLDKVVRTDMSAAWRLVEEMRTAGLVPDTVTASILLKGVQPSMAPEEADRVFAVVVSMREQIDEVLLSSLVEACIRCEMPERLASYLDERFCGSISLSSSHTYGSLIRGLGVLKEVPRALAAWQDMRARGIVPTSITLGCMVETLATNGAVTDARRLIGETLASPETRPLVNDFVYCSVLKGYSHQLDLDSVWATYQEMLAEGIPASLSGYNSLLDACARSGHMDRVGGILEDMARNHIDPNLITYGTVIKGYCRAQALDKALVMLDHMKRSTQFVPDEMMFNTLLNGFAHSGKYEEGLRLLKDMTDSGVAPSNFTLSVLVKMASRDNKPEEAFRLCQDLSARYGIRLNVYVYNNLMQACCWHDDADRALVIFDEMVRSRLRPDTRTYKVLLGGCTRARRGKESVELLRSAFGLQGGRLVDGAAGLKALRPTDQDLAGAFVDEILKYVAGRCECRGLATSLLEELAREFPKLRLDAQSCASWSSWTGSTAARSRA